jgi:hypothetical protein
MVVGGVGDMGEGDGMEGSVCENYVPMAGGHACGSKCHTFALDPWYLDKSLASMSVFSFCTTKWQGMSLAPCRSEVGPSVSPWQHSADA